MVKTAEVILEWSVILTVSGQSKKVDKIRNRYNQGPHLTKDTTWESDKNTIKDDKREYKNTWPIKTTSQQRDVYLN